MASSIDSPLLVEQLQAVYDGVLTCDFCPQMFDNNMDRNSHILQHFAKEICLKCGDSLIRIGDQLFSLHSTLTCVQSANDLLFKDDCVQSDFVNETINFHDFADVQNKLIDVFEVKISPNEMLMNSNIVGNVLVTQSHHPMLTATTNDNHTNDNNNSNSTSTSAILVQSMATVEPPPPEDGLHLNYTQALNEMTAIQDHKSTSSVATSTAIVETELKSAPKNTTITKSRKASSSTSAWNSQMVKCEIDGCDKEMSRNALSYHMLKHQGARFDCDLCGASLSSKSGIRSHLLTHVQKDERLKCEICELTYATKSGLRKHQKFVHSNDRSKMLICFQCGEELRQPYLLREHMNKHTGLKPFICAYCTKSFRTKRLRSEHERIHTGMKPYKCLVDECDRSFLYLIDLKRHKYTVHGIYTKKYPCQVCTKIFSENMLLRKHMKSHNRIVEKKSTKKSTRAKKTKT